jgi:hypothetical protein
MLGVLKEYEAMFGPQPVPAHFGEVDVAAPFDAKRFYTVLRCSGMNPTVIRQKDDRVSVSLDVGREETALQKKRIAAAHVWADAKDPDRKKQGAYAREILGSREFNYLG